MKKHNLYIILFITPVIGLLIFLFFFKNQDSHQITEPPENNPVKTQNKETVQQTPISQPVKTPDKKPALNLPVVRGSVTDQYNNPVSDAEVRFFSEKSEPVETFTDKKGRFQTEITEAGEWIIGIESKGYIPCEKKITVPENGVEISAILELFGSITGYIQAENQNPMLYTVYAEATDSDAIVSSPVREDATFEMQDVRPGLYKVYLVISSHNLPSEKDIEVTGGQNTHVVLTVIQPLGSLHGQIMFPAGGAKPYQVTLKLLNTAAVLENTVNTNLDDTDSFTIDNLPEAEYEVLLIAEGLPRPPSKIVRIKDSETAEVVFSWGEGSIQGRVLKNDGTNADNYQVVLRKMIRHDKNKNPVLDIAPAQIVHTDNSGNFSFIGLAAGNYIILAEGENAKASLFIDLTENLNRFVSVYVNQAQSVKVQVLRDDSPVEQSHVMAHREPYAETGAGAITDKDGFATLKNLGSGEYEISAVYQPSGENQPLLKGRKRINIPDEIPDLLIINLE